MSILAIDAGTTGVTAVVVTPEGRIAAKGYQEFPQHFPRPGWVEHGPEEIWQATLEATRLAVAQVDASELKGIGITNQRETVVLWDRETLGSPRRAIVWQDRRTADICSRLRDEGHEERVADLTGLRLDPYFSGTKLVWLAENEPNTWALVESGRYAVGTVDSYLIARMTRGTWHVTDVSNASRTLLFDLAAGDWSDELCSLFGVPRDALPDLVPNWGEIATTDPASFLGLELPIAGVAGDQRRRCSVRPASTRVTRSAPTAPARSSSPTPGRRCSAPTPGCCRRPPGAARRCADLCARGCDLRDRRRRPVAARRPPDRRVRRRDRGDRGDRRLDRRCRLRARPDRAGRPPLGPARARPDHRHHPRHDRGPHRPGHARGDRLRGARRARDHAGGSRRSGSTAAPRPTTCSASSRSTRSGPRRASPKLVETTALGAAFLAGLGTGVWASTDDLRETWQLDKSFTPDPDRAAADAGHARWKDAVERSKGWAS